MELKVRRTIIAGVLSIAALIGVGFATYMFGGSAEDAGDTAVPFVEFSEPPLKEFVPDVVLRLGWGEGPGEVWADPDWLGSTVDAFAVTEAGEILIVDHPEWHAGARVRRFTASGRVDATWLTPPGSVLFEPFGNGIMFVTAKAGGPSEQLSLVSEDGSVEASFALPPGVNSTSLFRAENRLFVTMEIAQVAQDPAYLRIEPKAVPIVDLTYGGPVASPPAEPIPGAGADTAGRMFHRLIEGDSYSVRPDSTHTVTSSDGATLRLPGLAVPFGVDDGVVWMVLPRATAPETYIDRPGWPYARMPEAEVLAARMDGTLLVRMVVPWSTLLADEQRHLYLTKGALWVLDADTDGISVLRYEEVER